MELTERLGQPERPVPLEPPELPAPQVQRPQFPWVLSQRERLGPTFQLQTQGLPRLPYLILRFLAGTLEQPEQLERLAQLGPQEPLELQVQLDQPEPLELLGLPEPPERQDPQPGKTCSSTEQVR